MSQFDDEIPEMLQPEQDDGGGADDLDIETPEDEGGGGDDLSGDALEYLQKAVRDLFQENDALRSRIQDLENNNQHESPVPRFRIFPAKDNGDGTMNELAPAGDALDTLEGGRSGAFIAADSDTIFCAEEVAGVDMKYVEISGVSGTLAIISASAQDGSNKRWVYSLNELSMTKTAGYGGWSTKSGGITTTNGYNWIENMNGSSGLYGNGVNSANLSGTFDIQPAPVGAIVRMFAVKVGTGDDATTEYWFSYENGIDGSCGS